ncbi:putative calcium-binding protein cml14 [Stylosanthes scabra]|uniref:Calcium-binding protein cml14 n=1 Tax=Stylosanthes scabra TaxID=79078 RepID=A0ABU6XF81_9FABA|nr:putative calcium-binding protein cml14 [Stylosanthes scabra]
MATAMTPSEYEEQLRCLREIFSRFDMDNDGSLTMLELAALLRSLGINPMGNQIHLLWTNMDVNGNGYVEFDELACAILPDPRNEDEDYLLRDHHELLVSVFRSFDHDGDGYISAMELATAMARMGQPLTYGELREMVTVAGDDGDGAISFNEFASVMVRLKSGLLGLALLLSEEE